MIRVNRSREITQASTETAFIVSDVRISYRSREIHSVESLKEEDEKEYDSWAYVIKKKIETNASMYDNDREKIRYVLSQMKDSIFDVMHDWVIETENNATMKSFFAKIENYMRLHLLERVAKKELLIIFMKNIETISEFYHRIFKLWKRVKIFDKDRMNQFRIAIRFIFVNALLKRRYTDMKVMFEVTKKIEDQKNDFNNKYFRQKSRSQKKVNRN